MITININGLTLCHKGSGGVSHNTLPDVCKTPGEGIPVPYENEAYSADLVKGTVSVFADGGNMIANLGSQFARSVFDEQGSMGGVKSGTNKAEAEWISHSFDVFFEGKPACRLTDKMYMNHRNTVNMAGLQQDFLPPRPELDDESYIPPAEDDDKSYLSPAENSDKSETPPSENNDKSDAPPPEDKDKVMPCIVILVHGVNDVGEAYQNQDTGICRGLNTRLGRKDFQPHTWQPEQFMISDVEGEVANSPVIPFYWGYKPVEHSAWVEDQKRYRDDLTKKHDEADLPYDTYQEFNEENIAAHAGEHIDSRNNWLDKQHANARGGGTFANATTSIPDIFGPGANGLSVWMVGEASRSWLNGGDWTHPVYSNPHRIYIAYAARRLADLILKIRRDSGAKNDTINVVAHSQGTIITMLANMWVKAEKQNPADCVILCHSPYSLENRWQENGQPGNQQTDDARQQTLAHFCNMMKKNGLHDGSTSHNADYISQLHANNCLTDEGQTAWATETYNRNNFGLVYNYFCPEDQVVSMMPIQGMGWRGIPDPLSRSMGDNIRQRVFCKDEAVGNKTGYRYVAKDIRKLDRNRVPVPEPEIKDPDKPIQDVIYLYNDVIINAPLLPASFNFTLNGQDNNYRSAIDGNDVNISRAAMMAEAFVTENIDIPNTAEFHTLPLYQFLNNEQLSEVSALHNIVAISGQKVDVYDVDYYARHEKLKIQRRMKEDEIESALLKGTTYSQHSSIVSNDDVPEKAMTYDLAIGQCKAYEKTEFWRDLLLQADWRRPDNPDTYTRRYYSEGKLPDEFKKMMNKPETGEKPMPTGENGVVNDYGPRREIDWRNGKWVSVTQWDQPDPVPPELL